MIVEVKPPYCTETIFIPASIVSKASAILIMCCKGMPGEGTPAYNSTVFVEGV
jgi:hypothetical protein